MAEDQPLRAAREWAEMSREEQRHNWERLGKNDKIRLEKAIKMLEEHRDQQGGQSQSRSQSQSQSKDRTQGRDRGGRGQGR
jgi:hypothetical protein